MSVAELIHRYEGMLLSDEMRTDRWVSNTGTFDVKLPTVQPLSRQLLWAKDGQPSELEFVNASQLRSEIIGSATWVFQDRKAFNVNGGTFSNNAWRTRDLNTTVITSGSEVVLSSNQLTITPPLDTASPAKYLVESTAPAFAVRSHISRIQDLTNNVTLVFGTSEFNNGTSAVGRSLILDSFSVSSPSIVVELQHFCQSNKNNEGFGRAHGLAAANIDNVYSIFRITRIN